MRSFILLIMFWAGISTSGIPEHVKFAVDQRVEHGMNPSIVLGLYENGQTTYYVKGQQAKDSSEAVTKDSVYEIGSITKTFTGLLLAQSTLNEKLNLNDPVSDHIKEISWLRDSAGQDITFMHLTTHTSGLPRLPDNMNILNPDPYADYSRGELMTATSQVQPQQAGVNYLYSNFAVGLLGEALASVHQSSFNRLVQERILSPLQLKHTYMTLEEVPESLLVTGYQWNRPANPWRFQALAGAGSIRSSVRDLLEYGIAHLHHPDSALHEAMQRATKTLYEQDGLSVGMGWHKNNGIIWHNGGTLGFRSVLMLDAKNQRVAAGITNTAGHDVEDLVSHLMNSEAKLRSHDFPVAIDAAELPQFVGQFKNQKSGQVVTVKQVKDTLFFQPVKQPKQRLQYIGNDQFKVAIVKAKLSFKKDQSGRVTGFEFKGWGSSQEYNKVDTSGS